MRLFFFIFALLGTLAFARIWTDTQGRKVEGEYLGQTDTTVKLKLKNGNEVAIPIERLSKEDLSYLVDRQIEEASKNPAPPTPTPSPDAPAGDSPAPEKNDPRWEKPILKTASLDPPMVIETSKNNDLIHFTSPNFRLVADGRIRQTVIEPFLEACELAHRYTQSLPFGLTSRFPPVDGKFEIHAIAKNEDWIKRGFPENAPYVFDPGTGQQSFCFENAGFGSSGRGSDDRTRALQSRLIIGTSQLMMPELYERKLGHWFTRGLPEVINSADYKKSTLDYSLVAENVKKLLFEKSPSGQKAIFDKKEIEMMSLADLTTSTLDALPEEKQRPFLAQSLLLVTYLTFMADDGKANGLRTGLKHLSTWQENLPKTITAATQEEAEAIQERYREEFENLGEASTTLIFNDRPYAEIEKDLAERWKAHGLILKFPK